MGNLKRPKEFEGLPSDIMYLTNTFDSNTNSGYKQCQLIAKAKKDAWKNLAESIKFKEDGGGRTEEDGMQFDFDKFNFD